MKAKTNLPIKIRKNNNDDFESVTNCEYFGSIINGDCTKQIKETRYGNPEAEKH